MVFCIMNIMEYSINRKRLQNLSTDMNYAINKIAAEIISEVLSLAESGKSIH